MDKKIAVEQFNFAIKAIQNREKGARKLAKTTLEAVARSRGMTKDLSMEARGFWELVVITQALGFNLQVYSREKASTNSRTWSAA